MIKLRISSSFSKINCMRSSLIDGVAHNTGKYSSRFSKINYFMSSSLFDGVAHNTGKYRSELKTLEVQKDNKVEPISSKLKKSMKVVFDLDSVLITDICPVDDQDTLDELVRSVGKDSIVESCGYYFYLYNGWKELIKYVMELSDNNLIFFSSCERKRNEDIIPKMLERVLERDPTEYMKNNVKIYSRHHTLCCSSSKHLQPYGMFGNLKKDLTVIVSPEELKHTLLIDDDDSYVICGQEKNLLRVDGDYTCIEILRDFIKLPRDQKPTLDDEEFNSKYFLTINKLCYAAGVLKDISDKYSKSDRDLIDIMYDTHGYKVTAKDDGRGYDKNYEIVHRLDVYQSGLEVLRERNNDLDFLIFPTKN